MYLYLAIFWFVVGVLVQIYWDPLQEYANFRVDRPIMGAIFFILFTYNIVRWRMARIRQRTDDDLTPPPRPRVVHREYDPNLDFTKPDDEKAADDKPKR